jgi:hypothetical protein
VKSFFLFVLFVPVFLFGAYNSTRYTIDTYFTKQFNGLGRGENGNIYAGLGHSVNYLDAGNNCALFRFDFNTDKFVRLGTVKDASLLSNNWVAKGETPWDPWITSGNKPWDGPGKIHTSIIHYQGKIYFGSHYSLDGATYQEDLDGYQQYFRGGHLYAYDLTAKRIFDINGGQRDVMAPSNGLMDIALDPRHGAFFGIGYPEGKVYRHDLATHHDTMVWQSPDGAPVRNGGYVSRNLIMDNEGVLWYAFGSNLIGLDYTKGPMFTFNPTYTIPFPDGKSGPGRLAAVSYSATRDTIFFIRFDSQTLYMLRPKEQKIDILDTGVEGVALAQRWDLQKLYYLIGYKSNTDGKLHIYDIKTGAKTSETVSNLGSGRWFGTGDPIDKNGDMWVVEGGSGAGVALKIDIPEPCAICGQDIWNYPSTSVRPDVSRNTGGRITVWPNPFSTSLEIEVPMQIENLKFEIFNLKGQQVYSSHVARHTPHVWDASIQPAGLYLVKVRIGEKQIIKRVVLQK